MRRIRFDCHGHYIDTDGGGGMQMAPPRSVVAQMATAACVGAKLIERTGNIAKPPYLPAHHLTTATPERTTHDWLEFPAIRRFQNSPTSEVLLMLDEQIGRAMALRNELYSQLEDDPEFYLYVRMPEGESKLRVEGWLLSSNKKFKLWFGTGHALAAYTTSRSE
jgi:hypothetical protein